MIWAQDTNNAIGRDGTLPWHFSQDLKNFKKLTTGYTIIMGRKTWDSLPFKPLPSRRNIVISSNNRDDVESYTSIDQCIDAVNKALPSSPVALGFEAVTCVPVRNDPNQLLKARKFEGARPWSAAAGPAVLPLITDA